MQDVDAAYGISKFFREKLNLEVPSADTDLFETGVLDSMGFVELLIYIEREFGIRVALEEMEVDNFRSMERITEFVAGQVSVKGPGDHAVVMLEAWKPSAARRSNGG